VSNKWLEEVLSGKRGFGYDPIHALAASITIRQYQKANGYPVNKVMFKVDGEWRDMDEILAGPDA